ncbi:helix-turn-helix domain-containing protein [Rhizobium leguminosarum]|uniref:helix-turn-helix transcriptional regulator n=1 Tax=Rhizobium leguminosarum TaxID=384 RepID=UPI001C983412|nr:helix-turn-helix domain-containing protein [Rhizobium leguminosarum]MBY5717653.1 helix-turn-helix domain-containing protein [Rhizobium leguminosarum]
MTSIIDKLLTARESAAALDMSVPTFYRLLKDGRLPAPIRIGSHPRWPESEIQGVIETAKQLRAA